MKNAEKKLAKFKRKYGTHGASFVIRCGIKHIARASVQDELEKVAKALEVLLEE